MFETTGLTLPMLEESSHHLAELLPRARRVNFEKLFRANGNFFRKQCAEFFTGLIARRTI
jgi:hypothetical protein